MKNEINITHDNIMFAGERVLYTPDDGGPRRGVTVMDVSVEDGRARVVVVDGAGETLKVRARELSKMPGSTAGFILPVMN